MNKIKIGVIGCGFISMVYLANFKNRLHNVEVAAVADLHPEKAKSTAKIFGIPVACTSEELLRIPDIKIVLNLTLPAVHYRINKRILEAGKHVYCEIPLAITTEEARELVELAEKKGLMCISAPDTFLGGGIQECRRLLDSGIIGKPFGFTANMHSPGHELWHPNPGYLYEKGAGPLFDMGPYYLATLIYLLGPVKRLSCFTTTGRAERDIFGTIKTADVPLTYTGSLQFACGVVGNVYFSLDTWYSSLPHIEIYGTEGTICSPDPVLFNGQARFYDGKDLINMLDAVNDPYPAKLFAFVTKRGSLLKDAVMEFPQSGNIAENMRGLGVSDMAQAIINNRPPRIDPHMSLHVVEIMNAMEESANTGRSIEIQSTCERTAAMDPSWDLWEVR